MKLSGSVPVEPTDTMKHRICRVVKASIIALIVGRVSYHACEEQPEGMLGLWYSGPYSLSEPRLTVQCYECMY